MNVDKMMENLLEDPATGGRVSTSPQHTFKHSKKSYRVYDIKNQKYIKLQKMQVPLSCLKGLYVCQAKTHVISKRVATAIKNTARGA